MSRTPMSPQQVIDLAFAIGEENARPVQPLNDRAELERSFGPEGATVPLTEDATTRRLRGGAVDSC